MSDIIPEQIIDFHVHLFPDPLFKAIWDFFAQQYDWHILYKYYAPQCIDYLRSKQVSHIIYSNYAHKAGVAEGLNQWNIETLNRNSNLFCFAAFHPEDENCLQMAEKMLSHPRVIGFKLQHLVQDFYPTDERLFPLYEMVIEKNKRILFHVGNGPASNEYVGFKNFLPLMKRYPHLPATVAHLGGYEFEPFFDLLGDHDNLMMDTTFCFFKDAEMSFSLSSDYLENNQDRLVYGSDFPNLTAPRHQEIEGLQALGLSKIFYQKLFRDNGKRLLDQHCPGF